MSNNGDFLSGFSGGNTQKPLTEQNEKPVIDKAPTEKKAQKKEATDVAKNKKLADEIVKASEKNATKTTSNSVKTSGSNVAATQPKQNANAIIKAPAHVVTRDEKFHKRTLIKYGVIGGATVLIAIIGFVAFILGNNVEVPNFVGGELRAAEMWQVTGGANISQVEAYSLEYAEGLVAEQSHEAGSRMSRNSVLTVTVSRGPDMNEIIELPDFSDMTRGQINTWMTELRLRGVVFREVASNDIEANHVIEYEFPASVDPDNFRRSDSVTIFVSTGPATVQLGNLVGDMLEEVREFIEENPEIVLVVEEEPHDTIDRGIVLRQTPSSGTRLAAGDTLTVVVSAGDPITVPNWANIRRINAEIDIDEQLNFRIEDRFDGTVPFGRFISQTVEAGNSVFPGHAPIRVFYSLGRPWIPNMVGSFENEIQSTFSDFNDQGAVLTFRIDHVDSYEPRGTIISQNIYNQFVNLNAHVNFRISRGNLNPPAGHMPDMDMGEE